MTVAALDGLAMAVRDTAVTTAPQSLTPQAIQGDQRTLSQRDDQR